MVRYISIIILYVYMNVEKTSIIVLNDDNEHPSNRDDTSGMSHT